MASAAKGRAGFGLAVLLMLWLQLSGPAWAQSPVPAGGTNAPAGGMAFAKTEFQAAQARYRAEPRNLEAALHFGRACFELAELVTTKADRAELANQGIAACQKVLAGQSNSAPAHYYLGLNYGQLARTRGLSALKLVSQMRDEWETARRLDAHLDHAGPDRQLGLIYRDAPAFGSIGSRKEAREHLLRAVELDPTFPENRLMLIETFLKWGERPAARRELNALEQVWPRARAELTGPAWAGRWADWEAQLKHFQTLLAEPQKGLRSPRHPD